MTAPILVFGWGNPSRGDDALGPLFVERVVALGCPAVDCLTDYQLQVEHTLDMRHRQRILFVDASLSVAPPFAVSPVVPAREVRHTSHALHPEALLQLYQEIHDTPPPAATLLAIRGESFALGAALSPAAACHLDAACRWASGWLMDADAVVSTFSASGELC